MSQPADIRLTATREALEAASHIAECGDHPEHLLDAETKARAAVVGVALVEEALAAAAALYEQVEMAEADGTACLPSRVESMMLGQALARLRAQEPAA